ncbi:MAG: hypothetical protein ACFFCX_15705 [Candidatus Sifarchaeia archaeon]
MIFPLFKWLPRAGLSGSQKINFFWMSKEKHVLVLVGLSPEHIKGTYEIKVDDKSKAEAEFEGNFVHTIPIGKGKKGAEFWFEFGHKTESGVWQVTGILTDEIQSKKITSEFSLDASGKITLDVGRELLSYERPQEAIWFLREYCYHNSNDVDAHFEIAKAFEVIGNHQDAKRYRDYAHGLKPATETVKDSPEPLTQDEISFMLGIFGRYRGLNLQALDLAKHYADQVLVSLFTFLTEYLNAIIEYIRTGRDTLTEEAKKSVSLSSNLFKLSWGSFYLKTETDDLRIKEMQDKLDVLFLGTEILKQHKELMDLVSQRKESLTPQAWWAFYITALAL